MATSDKNEIYLSASPHFFKAITTQKIMLAVALSLLPLIIYGTVIFGLHALLVIIVAAISAVFFEWAIQKLFKKPVLIFDGSALVTGLLLALSLPSTTPIWMVILGSLVSIVIAKEFFGGIGSNVFNPALIGRGFLFVSFPQALGSTWFNPLTDAISSATILSKIKEGSVRFSHADFFNYFIGDHAGCIGETSIALIFLAGIILTLTKIIDWRAPVAMIASVALFTLFAGKDPLQAVLTGGLVFGAVFMATDYTSAPVTPWGRIIFGLGCGIITFLIRQFGGYPEGVMFSILIMNALTPFLNKIIGRKYGYPKKVFFKGVKK